MGFGSSSPFKDVQLLSSAEKQPIANTERQNQLNVSPCFEHHCQLAASEMQMCTLQSQSERRSFSVLAILKHLLFSAILFVAAFAGAAAPAPKPQYLSYEQRLVLSYLLAGAGESQEKQLEVANRFQDTLNQYLAKDVQVIQVKNFKEFLAAYQGPWPESHSLESNLAWIEKSELRGPVKIKANSAKLQSQIEGFVQRQNAELVKSQSAEALNMVANLTSAKSMAQLSPKGLLDARQKREWILDGFKVATDLLHSRLESIKNTGAEIAASGKLDGSDAALKSFLTTAFNEYFGRLSLATKKQIISQVLGRNLNMSSMEKFELMILSSGPQFQKLLQIVAREAGVSPDLLAIFKKLESKAQAAPAVEVKKLLEAERAHYNWISYDLAPLGTGTMAQVHRGTVRTSEGEREVVIRFLKPAVAARVSEDYRILTELAPIIDNDPKMKKLGFPKLQPVVKDLNKTVTDELDLESTIERQIKGREIYTRQVFMNGKTYKNAIDISVPEVIMPVKGSNLHVQELVTGTKLDKLADFYKDSIPDLKTKVVEQLASMWMEEVIFKSGFYHSDLHQGNFMVELTDPAIKVHILDFGMGGFISKDLQSSIVILGAGIELNNSKVISKTLWNLSDKAGNAVSEADFVQKVEARVQMIKAGKMASQSTEQWSSWAMDEGLKFPFEFVSLNRGLVILDRMLKEAGSTESTTAIGKAAAKRNARNVLYDLKVKGELSWSELAKLGWVSLQSNPQPVAVKAPVAGLRCQAVHL